jgi:hypothetical protein
MQCREVKSWLVSELVWELQFICCDLLLLQDVSWGKGIVRGPRVGGTSSVGSRYRATAGENKAEREDLVRSAVNSRVYELAIAL